MMNPVKKSQRGLVPATAAPMPAVVREFQSDVAAIELQPDPILTRGTLWLSAALIVAAIVWASIGTIDKVVTARGRIVSDTPTVVVQPLETSIVRAINVKPGDIVKAGDVLATLDPTFTAADVAQLKTKKDSLDAQIDRLRAQLGDKDYVPAAGTGPNDALLQTAIFRQAAAQYRSQLQSYDGKIAKLKAELATKRADQQILTDRVDVLKAIEKMRTTLETGPAQAGSRLQTLVAADQRLEAQRNLELTINSIKEISADLDSAVADREAFIGDSQRKTAEDLVAATRDRDQTAEQLVKADKRQSLITLTAQTDSMVLETAQRSVGSVVREAETLFTLVPLNAPLEVEAQIEPRDLGSLKANEEVRIKLDAYPFQQHGTMKGIVRSISEDTITRHEDLAAQPVGQGSAPPSGGQQASPSVYRARIEITASEMRNVSSDFRLIPGMPLTAELKIGSRPMITYFTDPITRSLDEGLRDP